MNFMIRLASAAALFTFWLATIVWTVLIVAAPANAAPSNEQGAGSTSTSAPADGADKSPRQAHLIPGFKPQPSGGQAHLIPGFKPQPAEPPAPAQAPAEPEPPAPAKAPAAAEG